MEHVQVDDKALIHRLCRDFVFRGLAYGAERWFLSLQRMCERFACEMVGNATGQDLGGGTLTVTFHSDNIIFLFCFPLSNISLLLLFVTFLVVVS